MVQFTFDGLFRTTNKGLPDTASIDPYTYISMNHFVYSLIIQVVIGLILTGYTGMAVYRAFYKIKNQKFFPSDAPKEQQAQKQQAKSKSQNQPDENTNDNLIYRFDQEQGEKEKQQGKEQQQEQNQQQVQQQTVSQQTTEWFLELDHKMLYFQPFLISFIVVVSVFATNVFAIILFGLGLVLFFLFNIKNYCANSAITQFFFTIPCIAAFLLVYFQDRDMST